jgi:nicotinamide-nucleotide amidase
MEQRIRAFYVSRGREVHADSLRLADVPVGATMLPNTVGTAPGLRIELGAAVVVCLPGVPAEMRSIVDGSLVPELAARAGGATDVGVLRVALVPESVIAVALAEVEAQAVASDVRMAYLPSPAEVAVRFVASASDDGVPGSVRIAPLVAAAEGLLGDVVAVRGPGSLAAEVIRLARAADATVAVAESLTGGAVAAALTDVAGASHAFRGGVVAYATPLKAELLGVEPDLLARVGAVDVEVARAMAEGVRTRLGAGYGVATTGVAGPDPQDGHEPGTVHVAVAGPAGTVAVSPQLRGDRARIRVQTVTYALDLLRRTLSGLPPPGES